MNYYFQSYSLKGWDVVHFTLILLCILNSCSDPAPEDTSTPPNIILILTDDAGWGDNSYNGNTNLNTPNIDGLARNGVSFDRFFVNAVCSPTRAALLTGRYAVRSGVYSTSAGGERMDLDEVTIADYFKQAGYQTAAYGKWHNGMQYPYHPNARGFDDFYGFCSGHWGNYFSPMLEHNGEIVQGEGYLTDDLTSKGLAFIEKNKDQPFFLYLPFNTPHSPMQVPDKWYDKFADKPLDSLNRDTSLEDEGMTRAALAMVENIDWNVGRIVKKLQNLGLEENTIIVYLNDNGPNSWRWNGGMKGRKGSTDEGGVRSPLFIQWKAGLAAGKEIPQIAADIDLLPTLADLAGVNINYTNPLDGFSLKPLLMEEEVNWPDRFLINQWQDRISVRSQQYRLDHQGELFDMTKDPGQYLDVAAKFPEIQQKLQAFQTEWRQTVYSELPEKDTRTFPIGHPDWIFNQLPARDALVSGGIQRSNRWPNCSFFTNWTDTKEAISWDVEVLESGTFEVVVYYTCPEESIGSKVELSFGNSRQAFQITEAHDPPLKGMENDRVERGESYVKDWKTLNAGTITLEKGKGILNLKPLVIPGKEVMDFRLLILKRV